MSEEEGDRGGPRKGEISDWNEGNFKSMRLNDAQILINKGKANPFDKFPTKECPGEKFGYEWWFAGSDMVYGEGVQKYSDKEAKDIADLKVDVEKLLKLEIVYIIKTWDQKRKWMINGDNWKKLKPKLEEFEFLAKKFNDKHGLSTRNVKSGGMF